MQTPGRDRAGRPGCGHLGQTQARARQRPVMQLGALGARTTGVEFAIPALKDPVVGT